MRLHDRTRFRYIIVMEAKYVTLEYENRSFPAYVAVPASGGAFTPSVVVAMHLTGIDRSIRETAERFAAEGFAAIVPDLYWRFADVPNGDEEPDVRKFVPFAKRLGTASIDPDILASVQWLRERYPKTRTAIAGFCMGGVIALRRCAGYSAYFRAGAAWYGHPDVAQIDASAIDIPVVASYGAEDSGIPIDRIHAFFDRVPVRCDLKIYPGAGHAFFDRYHDTHEPSAAEDSWQRTIAFLRLSC